MRINIYLGWEDILDELSKMFCFEYRYEDTYFDGYGKKAEYSVLDTSFARKADLDDFIVNGSIGTEYGRASVLYSLYACRHLIIGDIRYPSYDDWKRKWGMSLDHKLPKKYFPELTFDCDNWQPLPIEENKKRGTDFWQEGMDELAKLHKMIDESIPL